MPPANAAQVRRICRHRLTSICQHFLLIRTVLWTHNNAWINATIQPNTVHITGQNPLQLWCYQLQPDGGIMQRSPNRHFQSATTFNPIHKLVNQRDICNHLYWPFSDSVIKLDSDKTPIRLLQNDRGSSGSYLLPILILASQGCSNTENE